MKPIKGLILVKPYPSKEVTEVGILIPETAQQRPSKAVVVATGDGLNTRPMELMEGDTVYHIQGVGEPVNYGGELLYFLRDTDCLARIPKVV